MMVKSDGIVEGAVYGSDVWRLYERWALSQSVAKGPTVMCTFKSKPVHTDRDQYKILEEAWSILKHFLAITEEAFEAGATENISGPVPDFLAFETVQHPKLAIAMAKMIHSPPPTYRAINAVSSGSYICDIVHTWDLCILSFEIFKGWKNQDWEMFFPDYMTFYNFSKLS